MALIVGGVPRSTTRKHSRKGKNTASGDCQGKSRAGKQSWDNERWAGTQRNNGIGNTGLGKVCGWDGGRERETGEER